MMMNFYLTTCLSFLIKPDMALQTLQLHEMNLRQFFTQSIFGIMVHISTVCQSGTEGPPPWFRPVSKTFLRV